ncbi:uncharacterized protein LOC141643004 [Silene latifolia]|uniref:uncharacterized protein LOC141643004 n=1 Tax=Silene latifolia TaxID=37657 RepID=UPI003D78554F
MAGPRRGSLGSRRGRGKRGRSTEEEQFEDMTPQPHPPRPARQFTPKIIRTPDDLETFTSPCTHGGSTLIRRVIDNENVYAPRELLTQTSRGHLTPILTTLDSDHQDYSHLRLEIGSSDSTSQGTQEQKYMEAPLYLKSGSHKSNSTEKENAMYDVFDGALVAAGTQHITSLQLENANSLMVVSAVNLPTMDALPWSATHKNASQSHEYDKEDSHQGFPSPANLHENVGSSSTNNGSKASSLNTTQIVEEMGFCKVSEAESMGPVNAPISLEGYNYKVKPHYVGLLTSILSNYGDIGANCSMESVTFRSICMEHVCDIVQTLKNTTLKVMTKKQLQSMMASISDLEKERVDVGWLRKRLDEIFEVEKAIVELEESSNLKKLHGEQLTKVETIKEKLEEYKRAIDDLQKKVNLAESDLSVAETQVSETENSISDFKAKMM